MVKIMAGFAQEPVLLELEAGFALALLTLGHNCTSKAMACDRLC